MYICTYCLSLPSPHDNTISDIICCSATQKSIL